MPSSTCERFLSNPGSLFIAPAANILSFLRPVIERYAKLTAAARRHAAAMAVDFLLSMIKRPAVGLGILLGTGLSLYLGDLIALDGHEVGGSVLAFVLDVAFVAHV